MPESKKKSKIRTQIFAYKGYVGISSDPNAIGLAARPENGNLGVVVDASTVDISVEALKLLKTLKKVGGSFAELMIFKAGNKNIIGWMGGYKTVIDPKKTTGDRDYDPSILKATDNVEIPESFKKHIDSLK